MGRLNPYLVITLIAALFFIPFLGGVHLFDWDEVNFAECAREMIESGNYLQPQINYQPFWEKPPLFFWIQSASMKIWGIGEFAARFPNAIIGIFTLLVLFKIGSHMVDKTFGWIWVGAYFGTVLPHLFFKSGIIDPLFNLFIFLSIYFLVVLKWKQKEGSNDGFQKSNLYYLLLAGLFTGLAVLTKGPVAGIIIGLTLLAYFIFNGLKIGLKPAKLLGYFLVATLVFITWYASITIKDGFWFVKEFTTYQYRLFSTPDAGHGGFPGYHVVVLFIGCFPASVFAIRSFIKSENQTQYQLDFRKWMIILFSVVLILFSIVQSKIVHYSSLCYFPLTFFAAHSVYQIIKGKRQITKLEWAGTFSIGGIFVISTTALPWLAQHKELIKTFFRNDAFALANLEADIQWTGFEAIAGIFLLAIILMFFFFRNRKIISFAILFIGVAMYVQITLWLFITKIEGHTQHAAIEFYKELRGEDCYVTTLGHKSYAHLFYSQKKYIKNETPRDIEWLIHGPIDKDVYVITKINKAQDLIDLPGIQKLYEKNGFVFYKREKIE